MRRPNILILYTDQQRWDALGVEGNPDIVTPHLDALARSGVRFTHHFVQSPVCMPSRASMLTGRYPASIGVQHMGVPLPADTVTLPRLLRNYGYFSANIGKLHFLPHANRDHREPHPDYGFDQLEISDEPGCYTDAYRAWVRHKSPEHLDDISLGLPPATQTWQRAMGWRDEIRHPEERFPHRPLAFRGPDDLSHTAFVAEQSLAFLRAQRDRPFLCIAGFYSPHSPWVAPQRFLDLYDPARFTLPPFPAGLQGRRETSHCGDADLRAARHGYYGMVSEVDHHVGRILAELDALGLAQNTIVVFTSDHGEWLGEHLRYGKGHPAHDCVSRVPLLVRWPAGGVAAGRCVSQFAEAVDLVPTLLEGAGIPLPGELQGHSLLSALRGEPHAGRDSALTEHVGWKTLRTARHRYLCHADGREALYDLEADPLGYAEVTDDPAHHDALAACRHLLLRRLLERERPLPRTWTY